MDKLTGIDKAIAKYRITKYVNKEKGTVTLKLDPERAIMYSFLRDVTNQLGFSKGLRQVLANYMYSGFTGRAFVATAKCSPQDTFQEGIGASIAFRKLKGKFRKYVIHGFLEMENELSEASSNIYKLYAIGKLQGGKDIKQKDVETLFEKVCVKRG